MALPFVTLLIGITIGSGVRAVVIAPPWGNVQVNPCASVSWQYLMWVPDGKCYPIFKQGPCPPTHELVFDAEEQVAKCQCPSDRVFWQEDQRCYEPFSTGPCPEDSFLHPGKEISQRSARPEPHRRTLLQVQAWLQQSDSNKIEPLGMVHCKERGSCPSGWAFWPATELCYPLNSQGPCHSGSLFYWNRRTQQAQCGCAEEELKDYYWPISATCHEHNSQGPCKLGQVFVYNNVTQTTQCSCSPRLRHFHGATGKCFEKFTKGPCSAGQWLTSHPQEVPEYSMPASTQWKRRDPVLDGEYRIASMDLTDHDDWLVCTCLPGHVYSHKDDACYREFTQGPCKSGHFFARHPSKDQSGSCVKNPCDRNELFFPEIQRCFRIHSRGPCGLGQIVISDDQHGISYRGRCGCSSVNAQNYWAADGRCYQLETTGPCVVPFVFNSRSANGITPQCSCPVDQVFYPATQKCYKQFTQGPCEWNEWLVPRYQSPNDVLDGQDPNPPEYVCQCKPGYEYQPGSTYCQPPSVELLRSLNNGPPQRVKHQQRMQRRSSARRRPYHK